MAQAIAQGLVTSGTVDPANISASATSTRFMDWWTSRGMTFSTNNNQVIHSADIVFIAVKPHLYTSMLATLSEAGHKYGNKLWVSIMAGVVLDDLVRNIKMVSQSAWRSPSVTTAQRWTGRQSEQCSPASGSVWSYLRGYRMRLQQCVALDQRLSTK